ncbi:NADH-quinone oxidoreductase subunit NuoN [uncultured Sphingorhabdus sp.]|uniref:NADH-quinone oxidoreductase subunit NuoN n=1 Tax=uncultured Sphingorhabdus sp. TaxID=1686106 RepID=UPI00261CF448|nr:NADH-quinone oxidoreductase subunit NuoN [uncultured Sphingorhabdus sp.]HMS18987.1 NADH-quinone oxidoreductase subunit NuoN [Sphingorhabdus sp.]
MDLSTSLYLVRPELILSFSSLALLLIAAWRQEAGRLVSILSVAALVGAGAYAVHYLCAGTDASAFEGLYRADAFGSFAKILIYFAAAISLMIAPKALEKMGAMRAEYPVLVILAAVGMGVMVSATDLLTLYIGLELNSLAAYVLASFARNDGRSAEAGLKYFVLGALASGILLFGMSLLYGFTGSTSFETIGTAMTGELSMGLLFGLVFVLSGLAFKISAAPFHMWTPDVYEGAPTPVTAFFASAPKVAASALLIRIVVEAFGNQVQAWQQIVMVVALMSIIIGAVGAIGQQNLKRLLAYSSINNVGFLLIGLAAGTEQGVAAMLVYLAIYVAMTLGGFVCLMQLKGRDGEMKESMADIAGLSKTRPALAAIFAIFMFSLAGIPPLFGFYGKLVVFNAAISAGLFPLAVIGIAASVIGAFYYLKVVKTMYFDESGDSIEAADDKVLRWTGGALGLVVSALGYLAIPLLGAVTAQAAGALF